MNYINSEILLTVTLGGRLRSRGEVVANQKVDEKGNKMFGKYVNEATGEVERYPLVTLKTTKSAVYHNANQTVRLGNQFVRFAISMDGKPSNMGKTKWNSLSQKQKLDYHVHKYVREVHGNVKSSYEVLD